MDFNAFFETATRGEKQPYPYQERLASGPWPELLDIPTGLGKTAAIVLAWIYKRRIAKDADTPRRLVYCLPMRVLVEQTYEETRNWLKELKGFKELSDSPVSVHLLMGGDVDADWQEHPEADCILIGTQDQLLSRALNRGYAASRAMWPWHFAFLNNDCLWVIDETQLMGVGLPTTAQLQALRSRLRAYGPAHTLWMSATLDPHALETVDAPRTNNRPKLVLTDDDRARKEIQKRLNAKKAVQPLALDVSSKDYAKLLADRVVEIHAEGDTVLVVLNRVARAQEVFQEVVKRDKSGTTRPLLIHGRFRPYERRQLNKELLEIKSGQGRVVIATQTVEAGVDLDAKILFTELAPWSSLVQRFGRCNRAGLYDDATIFWIDVNEDSQPYTAEGLTFSRETLGALTDGGPASVSQIRDPSPPPTNHVLRRKDLLELFDTTPDLTGADLDISRYIREGDDNDVQFYWREWEDGDNGKAPPDHFPRPISDELCSVSIGQARKFLEKQSAWRWDFVDGRWEKITGKTARLYPGLVLLLHKSEGGYSSEIGWTRNAKDKDIVDVPVSAVAKNDAAESDSGTFLTDHFVTLTEHSKDVAKHAQLLRTAFTEYLDLPWDDVINAARWHDVGKAHPAFQNMLLQAADDAPNRQGVLWAKSDNKNQTRPIYATCGGNPPRAQYRRFFRHELASALAMLATGHSDLSAYLAACHHGKVRLSLRSQAGERPPEEILRFARGVWERDKLPAVDLGDGIHMPETELTLSYMELGKHPQTGLSWLERALALREFYGPFRLALIETLVRVADWRATREEKEKYS